MKYYYDKEFDGICGVPNCADEALYNIWAYGCDYDGCNTVEGLKELIDELVKLSQDAREFIEEGKLNRDNPDVIAEGIASRLKAEEDMKAYRQTDEYKERFHENLGR